MEIELEIYLSICEKMEFELKIDLSICYLIRFLGVYNIECTFVWKLTETWIRSITFYNP